MPSAPSGCGPIPTAGGVRLSRAARRPAASGTRRSRRRGRAGRGARPPRPAGPRRPRRAAPAPRRGSRRTAPASNARPSSSDAPRVRHCHSCEREISAVAASSIRLSMAAAPTPRSQESRYASATRTFARTPGLGDGAAGHAQVEQLRGRRPRPPRAAGPSGSAGRRARASKTSVATGTRSGCATHVPSNPSPDLALLVVADPGQRDLGDGRVAPVRDERRHPADRVRPAAMAGPDEQLRVGAHERHGHRQLRRGPGTASVRPTRGTS